MFIVLCLFSIMQCIIAGATLISGNESTSLVALILFIFGIVNAIVYGKLDKMEERTKWLSTIAKEKGYKDPTETNYKNDNKKDG